MDLMKKIIISFILLSTVLFASSTQTYADNVGGWITGTWSGSYNKLKLDKTLTGDMLFGYNNGVKYGVFSHVALVQKGSVNSTNTKYPINPEQSSKRSRGWDGLTVESTQLSKKQKNSVYTNMWQSHFRRYDAAVHTYVNIKTQKKDVIKKAKKYSGKYGVNSSYKSNDDWYCTKLASRAYYDVSKKILGKNKRALRPETLYYDKHLVYVTGSYSGKYDGDSLFKKAKGSQAKIIDAKDLKTANAASLKSENNTASKQYNSDAKLEGKKTQNLEFIPNTGKPGFVDYLNSAVKEKEIDITNKEDLDRLGLTESQAKALIK